MNTRMRKAVGVIVARFQVPALHEGHLYTVNFVAEAHDDVLIILGVSPLLSDRNPLSFEMRKGMVERAFPDKRFVIVPSYSLPSSYKERSRIIDELIMSHFPKRDAVIYGSRDSFVHTYQGKFTKREVPTVFSGSATEIRENIGVINSTDFRSGVIYAAMHRKPHSHPSVDVAIVDHHRLRVLLVGKHAEEGKLRFPGVFFNPELDSSYEDAGLRCVAKETPGVSVGPIKIAGSRLVKDWRCRKTANSIITLLTVVRYLKGEPIVGKGIDKTEWIHLRHLSSAVIECHKPLVELLQRSNIVEP